MGLRLLSTAGAGAGTAKQLVSISHMIKNHLFTFFVWGTFGGSTVTVEISPDGTNWFPVTGLSWTVLDVKNAEFRALQVRGVVTGGAGQSINMEMV